MIREVFPGTALRFVNEVTGVTDQDTSIPLTFELRSQDGKTVLTGNVVQDTDPFTGLARLGWNYSDVLIPLSAPPGLWQEHWSAANALVIDQNRNDYQPLRVKTLPR